MSQIRILIVDDHPVFAETLAWSLGAEPDLVVVATAASAEAALRAVELRKPDIIVLDVELGGGPGGLEVIEALQSVDPAPRVVVVTAHDDAATAAKALSAGARGFVPKSSAASEITDVLRGVVDGETRIPARLLTQVMAMLRRSNGARSAWQQRVDRLTPREHQVLELMVSGLDRASIAERLVLSINTVRTHNKNILAKLEVHSSLEAVSVALRAGLRPESSNDRPKA